MGFVMVLSVENTPKACINILEIFFSRIYIAYVVSFIIILILSSTSDKNKRKYNFSISPQECMMELVFFGYLKCNICRSNSNIQI